MMSCCSKVQKCSIEGFCINPYKELREECLYRIKLKKGINFYNKYIYKDSVFIKIGNRLFSIGRRSSYGSYTYNLKDEEKKFLIGQLNKKNIKIAEKINFKLCEVDRTSDDNRACCLVILTTGDKKYNIKNFNTRTLTEATAIKVRDYFRERNVMAAIQYMGPKMTEIPNTKAKNTDKKVSKTIDTDRYDDVKENIIEGQISIFDLGLI